MSTVVQDISQTRDNAAPDGPKPSQEALDRLFDTQRAHALTLRASTAKQRIDKIKRLKQMMFERRDEICRACYADFKKPEAEIDATEILPVVQEANHAIRRIKKWMKPTRVRPTQLMLGTSAAVRYEPRGVCLIISPWNYPINLTFGPLISAIAAGNTVILKPSEMTPHCAALMQDMVGELFDEREVATIQGAVETTQQLLAKPFDHIFFTGSPAVGKIVMAAAAKHLTSVTLELGGKSPVIVDKTADVKKAARNLAWAKFANNGQTCIAPDYIFVHEDIQAAFAESTRNALEDLYGKPAAMAQNPDYCRMVNRNHYDRVTGLIDDAKDRGAHISVGGERSADDNFITPTVVNDVPGDARIMEEEIFGPIMPVLTFKDVAEPIAMINAKPKPLALYVFAKDNDFIERVVSQTTAGGTCINTSMVQFLHGQLPFGGVNNSGIGNSHGHWGFKAFSHERAVVRDRFAMSFLFMPPYNRFTKWFIRFAVKYMS